MNRKVMWSLFNLFFLGLFGLAVWTLFFNKKSFDDESIVALSKLKGKTFAAVPIELTLQNGAKVWFMAENSAPLVALDFYFDKAGFAFDEDSKQGLAVFASSILSKRAGDMDDETFQNLLNENAIDIDVKAFDDIFEISLTTPKENLNVAAELLNAVLTMPNTNANDASVVQSMQLASIDMQNENPEAVLRQKFKEKLFAGHPKSRLSLGQKEQVASFSGEDVKVFAGKHFKVHNLKVALAGAVLPDEALAFLNEVFKGLPNGDESADLPPLEADFSFKEENIERDIPQVISFFAAPGAARLDDDFYPLYMANEIFGGSGLSSRLNVRAREKEGLTYGAYTYLDSDKDAPRLVGTFSAAFENYEKMRAILLDEWQKMATEGVSLQEFETIKNNMLSAFHLRFSSLESIAKQLLYMQKENLDIDFFQKRNEYVSNVMLDEVNAAAKKYFMQQPSILTIGNNKGEK